MMQLRFEKRLIRSSEPTSKTVKILQSREEVQVNPNGAKYWTEWTDVPEVDKE